MARSIFIFDTTLRDGEQTPGISLNAGEKLQLARQLERLGVNAIEAGFPVASKGDFEAVKAIAQNVKRPVITALARAIKDDIDRAWEAIQYAEKPRIHTFIATSDLHMKYKLKMEPDEVLERAVSMVRYAKSLCPNVEFSPEDGSRTNPEFLRKVVEAVIDAGADVVNIPDTVGYCAPLEFGKIIKDIKDNVSNIDKAMISVHCHNDLGLAVANTLAAIENGADQVECAVNGLGERAGNAALEEIVMALQTRGDWFKAKTSIVTEQIYRTSAMVNQITGIHVQPNKAIVGINAFAHESGIHQHGMLANRQTYEIMTPESIGLKQSQMVLGKHSGRHAFEERLKELGYTNIEPEQIQEAFEKFKNLADKKKVVMDEDIEALISEHVQQSEDEYSLDNFHVSSGNSITATATVRLKNKDKYLEGAACGDGPVDAAFKAIDKLIDMNITLVSYSLRALTSGKNALGEVTIKLENNGVRSAGRSASMDVIEASVRAYINAINRMFYQQNN